MHLLSRAAPLLLTALVLTAGCGDPAQLAQEINAAREGCTEERLRAGDEECIRMMQRYAEMGTEAMQTYIGAVKSLDQALQRMPPAQFDTAGLGHALTPGAATMPVGGGSSGTGTPLSPAPSRAYGGGAGYGTGSARAWDEESARYDAPPGADRRGDRGTAPSDPRAGGWDLRNGYTPAAPYGADPRSRDRWLDGWDDAPAARPRAPDPRDPQGALPRRGGLLPPEQRLDRPWLREADPRGRDDPRYRDPRYDQDPRYQDPRYQDPRYDQDPRYQDHRYQDPRDFDPRYPAQGQPDPRYRAYGPRSYLPARSHADSLDGEALPPDPRRRFQRP